MKTLLLVSALISVGLLASGETGSSTAQATFFIEPPPAGTSRLAENDVKNSDTDEQTVTEDAIAPAPAPNKCVKSQDEAEKNCPSGTSRLSKDADGCYHCKKLPRRHHLGQLRSGRFRG
jgi:hypothetical protein